jgi:uncharacterized membrane protein YbaN (DUF454 family)
MLNMDESKPKPRATETTPGASRPWLIAGGWLLFTLGLVGIFLPVLPTTVFWIGAVWCWSRSAPQLTRRILSHPRFGRPVLLFLEQGQISRHGKWTAAAGMAAGFVLLHLLAEPAWLVSLLVGLSLAVVGLWLWQHPEPVALGQRQDEPPFADNRESSAEAQSQREG